MQYGLRAGVEDGAQARVEDHLVVVGEIRVRPVLVLVEGVDVEVADDHRDRVRGELGHLGDQADLPASRRPPRRATCAPRTRGSRRPVPTSRKSVWNGLRLSVSGKFIRAPPVSLLPELPGALPLVDVHPAAGRPGAVHLERPDGIVRVRHPVAPVGDVRCGSRPGSSRSRAARASRGRPRPSAGIRSTGRRTASSGRCSRRRTDSRKPKLPSLSGGARHQ